MQDLCVRFVKHVAMILMPHVDNWSAKLLTVRRAEQWQKKVAQRQEILRTQG